VSLHLRNFLRHPQRHRVEIHPPADLLVEPSVWTGKLAAESRGTFSFQVKAHPNAKPGTRIVAFDVTLDGRRYGERFDLVVGVEPAPGASPPGN
jgi:hypothetical protein